jgi:hypothetical protein
MNIERKIRSLAKNSYWQRVFQHSRDIASIGLFENEKNLSGLQILFLYWLEVYNVLYKELAQREWDILDEHVIKDNIRCDAFLYWRHQEQHKELAKYKQDMKKTNHKVKNPDTQRNFSIYSGGVKGN